MLKHKTVVAGRFAHDIHRGAFALRDAFNIRNVLCIYNKAHAFLTLVANDFLGREGGVSDRKGAHVDASASRFYELGKRVEVAAGAVVVNRDDGILFRLGEGPDHV